LAEILTQPVRAISVNPDIARRHRQRLEERRRQMAIAAKRRAEIERKIAEQKADEELYKKLLAEKEKLFSLKQKKIPEWKRREVDIILAAQEEARRRDYIVRAMAGIPAPEFWKHEHAKWEAWDKQQRARVQALSKEKAEIAQREKEIETKLKAIVSKYGSPKDIKSYFQAQRKYLSEIESYYGTKEDIRLRNIAVAAAFKHAPAKETRKRIGWKYVKGKPRIPIYAKESKQETKEITKYYVHTEAGKLPISKGVYEKLAKANKAIKTQAKKTQAKETPFVLRAPEEEFKPKEWTALSTERILGDITSDYFKTTLMHKKTGEYREVITAKAPIMEAPSTPLSLLSVREIVRPKIPEEKGDIVSESKYGFGGGLAGLVTMPMTSPATVYGFGQEISRVPLKFYPSFLLSKGKRTIEKFLGTAKERPVYTAASLISSAALMHGLSSNIKAMKAEIPKPTFTVQTAKTLAKQGSKTALAKGKTLTISGKGTTIKADILGKIKTTGRPEQFSGKGIYAVKYEMTSPSRLSKLFGGKLKQVKTGEGLILTKTRGKRTSLAIIDKTEFPTYAYKTKSILKKSKSLIESESRGAITKTAEVTKPSVLKFGKKYFDISKQEAFAGQSLSATLKKTTFAERLSKIFKTKAYHVYKPTKPLVDISAANIKSYIYEKTVNLGKLFTKPKAKPIKPPEYFSPVSKMARGGTVTETITKANLPTISARASLRSAISEVSKFTRRAITEQTKPKQTPISITGMALAAPTIISAAPKRKTRVRNIESAIQKEFTLSKQKLKVKQLRKQAQRQKVVQIPTQTPILKQIQKEFGKQRELEYLAGLQLQAQRQAQKTATRTKLITPPTTRVVPITPTIPKIPKKVIPISPTKWPAGIKPVYRKRKRRKKKSVYTEKIHPLMKIEKVLFG